MSEVRNGAVGFIELLKGFKSVEIPLIQRDYAQGRKSAEQVRKQFLDALHTALVGDHALHLDFVYGEVHTRCGFVPIDGQQRLTTLFLLHWYLAWAAGKERSDDFRSHMMDGDTFRFRYCVRSSSQEFMRCLLDFPPSADERKLSMQIMDQHWFFKCWAEDPTIAGALTMLDAIQVRFLAADSLTFYDRLVEGRVVFEVLDLGSENLSDDIYIRMNDRGRQLNEYEKFKAWLIKTHWHGRVAKRDDWPVKLDNEWLDLFWKGINPDHSGDDRAETASQAMFRTIISLAILDRLSEDKFPEDWLYADKEHVPNIWCDLFTRKTVDSIAQTLDMASNRWIPEIREFLETQHVARFADDNLLACIWEGGKDVSLPDRLWLHAITCVQKAELTGTVQWFRVVRNLLAYAEFRRDSFHGAIQSLNEMARWFDTGQWLSRAISGLPNLKAQGFDRYQLEEEALKASLMSDPQHGKDWTTLILQTENHAWFHGRIGVLLLKSYENSQSKLEANDIEIFKRRLHTLALLAAGTETAGKGGQDEYLLARAVLSRCTPFALSHQQELRLCSTAVIWRSLLNAGEKNTAYERFRLGFLRLIDEIERTEDWASAQVVLRKTIERYDGSRNRSEGSVPYAWEDTEWISDLVRDGHELLNRSHSKKAQNFKNQGIFVYIIKNFKGREIPIGHRPRWRNAIAKGLLSEGWRLEREDDLRIGDGFFRHGQMTLVRFSHVATVEYDKATLHLGKEVKAVFERGTAPTRNVIDEFGRIGRVDRQQDAEEYLR